jgi:hypothetical protein
MCDYLKRYLVAFAFATVVAVAVPAFAQSGDLGNDWIVWTSPLEFMRIVSAPLHPISLSLIPHINLW